mmetsp:Transcript_38471/g.81585  ORF Transcript_38471/g.81585 Transcript_38471/m.81585 type:complete len:119 (-) Transcript_38471:16-372(-)
MRKGAVRRMPGEEGSRRSQARVAQRGGARLIGSNRGVESETLGPGCCSCSRRHSRLDRLAALDSDFRTSPKKRYHVHAHASKEAQKAGTEENKKKKKDKRKEGRKNSTNIKKDNLILT